MAVKIDDKQLKQVELLAGLGLRDEDIARVVDISEATIKRRCKQQLQNGRAKARAKLAQTAWQMATSGKDATMTIFLCKTQLGWREKDRTVNTVEIPRLNVKILPKSQS